MTNVNRRFASALTALAVMGSGAQILAAPAQAGDNIDQKNDAKISCTEAQAAVDKAQADLKAAQDNLAELRANHKADKDKVKAAKKVVDEKQSALSDAKNALDDATTDKHVAELKDALADLDAQIAADKDARDKILDDIAAQESRAAEANERVAKLQAHIADIAADIKAQNSCATMSRGSLRPLMSPAQRSRRPRLSSMTLPLPSRLPRTR